MSENLDSYGLFRPQTNGNHFLSRKELALLRQAKRVGTSLEATARVILLLRAQKKAIG